MGKIQSGTLHITAKADQCVEQTLMISECKPGMELAETIYNSMGAVILRKGSVLESYIISKLQQLGIEKARVYFKKPDSIFKSNVNEFEQKYTENLLLVKDMVRDLSEGKSLNIKKLDYVSQSIIDSGKEKRDIFSCVNQSCDIDEYTYSHCINVGMLSMLIARWLNLNVDETGLVLKAGLLHDIGKSRIDPGILNKRTSLMPFEYARIKEHSTQGYHIIKDVPEISSEMSMGILMHHERLDGSGYPLGLKGEKIHEFARIIAVADVYDAMTSNRVYREKQSPFDVFEYMESGGIGRFDTKIIMTFLENVANLYIGDTFLLNTGEICEIVHINPRRVSRPLIKIRDRYVDMEKDSSLKITQIV